MRSPYFRIAAITLILGVGSLSLAACGKDASNTASTSATAAAASDASTSPAASAAATETTAAAAAETTAAEAAATTAAEGVASGEILGKTPNIFYTAVKAGSFLTLAKLLANADLIDTIKGPGPYTVFAPTDAAFAAVPADTLNALLADKAKLQKVLLYHVLPGNLMAADLKVGNTESAEGSTVAITKDVDKVSVNGVAVIAPDIVASNGVIQVIDQVLLPPDL